MESKIPSISGLTAISEVNAVENKTPEFSSLGKETDYDAKLVRYWLINLLLLNS